MLREINLLPHDLQQRRNRRLYLVRGGRLLRRLSVVLVIILAAQLVIQLFFSSLKQEFANTALVVASDSAVADQVTHINQLLTEFDQQVQQHVVWTDRVRDVLTQPQPVTVLGLAVPEDQSVLEVRGVALSRSGVVELQQALQRLPWVESVEAPLQNFTVGREAQFSLRLHLTPAL